MSSDQHDESKSASIQHDEEYHDVIVKVKAFREKTGLTGGDDDDNFADLDGFEYLNADNDAQMNSDAVLLLLMCSCKIDLCRLLAYRTVDNEYGYTDRGGRWLCYASTYILYKPLKIEGERGGHMSNLCITSDQKVADGFDKVVELFPKVLKEDKIQQVTLSAADVTNIVRLALGVWFDTTNENRPNNQEISDLLFGPMNGKALDCFISKLNSQIGRQLSMVQLLVVMLGIAINLGVLHNNPKDKKNEITELEHMHRIVGLQPCWYSIPDIMSVVPQNDKSLRELCIEMYRSSVVLYNLSLLVEAI
jgi:hypothetical protein